MIIGNGSIAKVIEDRNDVTFFASGVSDSSCHDRVQFQREIDLLCDQDIKQHLVYFSGHNIYTKSNHYAKHKKEMEALVKKRFFSYTIVRLGICDWVTTPTTIINHYKNVIKTGRPIVYNTDDSIRHIITLKDFKYWLSLIRVGEKEEMNITGRMITVPELIEEIKQGKL
jgi:hypothetical protein